jgi:homoserine dehydrogenase
MNSVKGVQIGAPLLKIGMLGAGVVGGQVARLLVEQNSGTFWIAIKANCHLC